MLNKLIYKIKDEFKKKEIPFFYDIVFQVLYEVLMVKYLCDQKEITFDDVMHDEKNTLKKLVDHDIFFLLDIDYKSLIHEIQYEDLKNIIEEFVLDKNNNQLTISNKRKIVYMEIYSLSSFYYDIHGNTAYIVDYSERINIYRLFELFDKVLNLKNKYIENKDINNDEYEELHYYGLKSRYSTFTLDERTCEKITDYVREGLRVILYTNYHRINNYRNASFTLKYLKNVIFLLNDESILIYEKKENDEISIINFDEENNMEKLTKIIL